MARNARGKKRPPPDAAEESEGEGEGAGEGEGDAAADAALRMRALQGAGGRAAAGPAQQDAPEV